MSAKRSVMKPKVHTRHPARKNGQALAELCVALVIVVPVFLIVLDCAFVFIGASLNDYVCRDAARAAASGPPSRLSPEAPRQRALAVIKHVYYSNLPMKVRDAVQVVETVRDVPPKSIGGAVDGEVTVGTTIDIYVPYQAPLIGSGPVVLKSQHTVPITYVLPAS